MTTKEALAIDPRSTSSRKDNSLELGNPPKESPAASKNSSPADGQPTVNGTIPPVHWWSWLGRIFTVAILTVVPLLWWARYTGTLEVEVKVLEIQIADLRAQLQAADRKAQNPPNPASDAITPAAPPAQQPPPASPPPSS